LTKTPNNHPYDINNTPTIVINVCSNKAVTDKRRLIPIVLALELITGQKGLLTKAKYSLATFRLKKGMEVGVKLTLKKSNM
jgi:large subunit ribosomal protein L5